MLTEWHELGTQFGGNLKKYIYSFYLNRVTLSVLILFFWEALYTKKGLQIHEQKTMLKDVYMIEHYIRVICLLRLAFCSGHVPLSPSQIRRRSNVQSCPELEGVMKQWRVPIVLPPPPLPANARVHYRARCKCYGNYLGV